MNYLYIGLQWSADSAALSDIALPGTIARPDSLITSSTDIIEIFGSEAEAKDNPFLDPGELR